MSEVYSAESKGTFNVGKILFGVTGGLAAIVTLVSIPFLTPAFRRGCLPYLPGTQTQISNVLEALKNRSGKLLDIGSGDGRIVRAAALAGFESHGVELNFWLVFYSRLMSLRNKSPSVKFHRRNLWKFDLSPYRNVVIFGAEDMMERLERKCLAELKDGSVIVASRYPFPNLKPEKSIGYGNDTVWKYKLPQ